ncbi:MAG: 40S ribosomal protein S19 [archaeon]|jgi:small subunit ribosomal protein S19e
MGIHDVPAEYLIEETAQKLSKEVEKPAWADYVKTGVHNERAPQREDWFYVRMASILYRAIKWGVIGTEALRSYYGGRRNRGVKREHHYKASGKVIRSAVQALEKLGYLEKALPKGRKASKKGIKLLNETSKLVEANMKENKYVAKAKEKKVFDEKKKKEVQDTLKMQDRGHGKAIDTKKTDKASAKKKEGSEQ